MRPFEAERRVYLVLRAHLLNEDAADALLKDLEEPPPYAVIVLVADELGLLPPTIRSRCQLVPFRRLSQRAIKAFLSSRGLQGEPLDALARVAAGRLDRAERLLDADAGERRDGLIELARSVYLDPAFDPGTGLARGHRPRAGAGGRARRGGREGAAALRDGPRDRAARQARGPGRRARGGARRARPPHRAGTATSWSWPPGPRAPSSTPTGSPSSPPTALPERGPAAERAAATVRDVWRSFEFNVQPGLTLEALFVRLRRELGGTLQA